MYGILIVRADNEEKEKIKFQQMHEELEQRFAEEQSRRDEEIKEITGKYVRTQYKRNKTVKES